MKVKRLHKFFAGASVLTINLAAQLAHAEVVLDGTLGYRGALDGPDYQIGAELGQQHGGNLFHSFETFNININESASFSGPNSVQNIISRVTGGTASHINGLLRSTIPDANFYLLNPYGIMFGEGAQLDVQGSFHASTADTLRFTDGGEFNARHPNQSFLTVAPVEAFGFLTDAPAAITVQDTELSVSEGETLSLIGGKVKINQAKLSAPFGRFNIASVAGVGDVIPKYDDFVVPTLRGDVTVQDSMIDASGEGGGAIFIRGGRFVVENSIIETNTHGDKDGLGIDVQADELTIMKGRLSSRVFDTGEGGDIKINVAGSIIVGGEEDENGRPSLIITSAGQSGNRGKVGNIRLQARQLSLQDGAIISAVTRGAGHSGNIEIRVTGPVVFSGTVENFHSGLFVASAVIEDDNAGNAGSILLEAEELRLEDGTMINAATFGTGQGGDITIRVSGPIHLSGGDFNGIGSLISSNSNGYLENAGDGGTIIIEAEQLFLDDGGQINASNAGGGQGGEIHLKVAKEIELSGFHTDRRYENEKKVYSAIQTSSASEANYAGNAGDIILEAGKLILKEGTEIEAATFGPGQGGDIKIQVRGTVLLSGESAGIFTVSVPINANDIVLGDAGNIVLKAEELSLKEGAVISAITESSGQGGDIKIMVTGLVTISSGGGIGTRTESHRHNAGDSGAIELHSDQLHLTGDTQITTETFGPGLGGDIVIQVADVFTVNDKSIIKSSSTSKQTNAGRAGDISVQSNIVRLKNGGTVSASTENAKGGNIQITSPGYLYLTNSQITTSVRTGDKNSGNITITPKLIALSDSYIRAQAYEGRGGNIDITTTGIYNNLAGRYEDPKIRAINASSELGIDGIVQINTPEIDILEGLLTLPTPFSETPLSKGCTPRSLSNTFLNRGSRKIALKNLQQTPWSSFYLDNKLPNQEAEKNITETNLFDEHFSVTKPLFGR